MSEPEYTINGKSYKTDELVNDNDVTGELDEFDLFNDDNSNLPRNKMNSSPKPKRRSSVSEYSAEPQDEEPIANNNEDYDAPSDAEDRNDRQLRRRRRPDREGLDDSDYVDYGKYKLKVTTSGYDWRGLPMINYLGNIRPWYAKIDRETNGVLRQQLISKVNGFKAGNSDLVVPSPDILQRMSMNELHTLCDESEKHTNAKHYAFVYKKVIYGVSMVTETATRAFGIKELEGATTHLKDIPFMDIVVTKLSTSETTKTIADSLSPPMLITFGLLLHFGVFYGASKIERKGKKNKTFGTAMNLLNGFAQSKNKKNVESDSEESVESEREHKKKKHKNKRRARERSDTDQEDEPEIKVKKMNKNVSKNSQTDNGIKVEEVEDEEEKEEKEEKESPVKSPFEEPDQKAKKEDAGFDFSGVLGQLNTFMPFITGMLNGNGNKRKKKKNKYRE